MKGMGDMKGMGNMKDMGDTKAMDDMKGMGDMKDMGDTKAMGDMKGMGDMKAMPPALGGDAPKNARDPFANSGGYEYRGMSGWEDTDEWKVGKFIADQFEYRKGDATNFYRWDTQSWYGTDYDKFWAKFEGNENSSKDEGELELQMLYSHSVAAFWDAQIGLRYDRAHNPNGTESRYFGVLGFQGLAPYWFEVEPALFISNKGDISGRLVATYDLLITQKLIFQPRLEVNISANDLPQFNIGKGINDLQLDLRLRYEINREFAPYIGLAWFSKYGKTADYFRTAGEATVDTQLVAGVRFWF